MLISGKVFILGEYSVIQGGSAVIAAIGPGYSFQDASAFPEYHQESPAGKWIQYHHADSVKSVLSGAAPRGLGSSIAELLSVVPKKYWPQLPVWYQEHFPQASGADLLVQMKACDEGLGLYQVTGAANARQVVRLETPENFGQNWKLYQASGQDKLATHENLKTFTGDLNAEQMKFCNELISKWIQDLESAPELHCWSEQLAKWGLQSAFSKAVTDAFRNIPEVIAVKGCGAGLNDTFIVVMDTALSAHAQARANEELERVQEQFKLSDLGTLAERLR